jgi:D-tyrosyl-tRNA(Tyr) deacylase
LRLFPDVNGKFHFSVRDIKGELMVISQFTLYGDTRRGRRPSFSDAMGPVEAEEIFNKVIEMFKSNSGLAVAEGQFGSHMDIKSINDGPVTIWLDSEDPR